MNFYVTVGALDTAQSQAFYDAALAAIGWSSHMDFPGWRAYSEGGAGKSASFWICKPFNGEPASGGNGTMVGFMVKSRPEVDAFYKAALAHGGTDEGAPNTRPHYGPDWYAAYVRDPAGNKVAVVCNG